MVDIAKAQMKEAEKAFMEEETKKLQQKFQKEKKALRAILKEKLLQAGLVSCYDYYLERHALKLC